MLFIGNEIKNRMNCLNISIEELSNKTFLDYNVISAIVNNKQAYEEIDDFNLSLICSVLHCRPEFFTEPLIRERDLLVNAMNQDIDNRKALDVKIKIQDFINDYSFINNILNDNA